MECRVGGQWSMSWEWALVPNELSGVARMRAQLFFDGPDVRGKLSRFWLLLLLAAVIASAGVVADSTATVIGAMIVAPLMVPILGCVVAVVLADRDNLLRCAGLVVAGSAAVVATGFILGLAVGLPVVASTNAQVASRVTPRLIDLIAALATGAVGSIALARDDISDTLPGVAIAISLVPPLAVVGLTLESGASDQALGALLLFVTNVSAILATGLLVMAIYRINRLAAVSNNTGQPALHRGRAVAAIVVGLVVIAIPLAFSSFRITETATTESMVQRAAETWATGAGWEVASVNTVRDRVLVRVTGPEPAPDTAALEAELKNQGLENTTVRVELIPSTSVELGAG
jgi:uncharacterized hydrophobic protein (TIGR00271 family)